MYRQQQPKTRQEKEAAELYHVTIMWGTSWLKVHPAGVAATTISIRMRLNWLALLLLPSAQHRGSVHHVA